jgi:hypothetical protein
VIRGPEKYSGEGPRRPRRGLRRARLHLRLEAGELVVDSALGAELVKLAIDVV